MGAPGDSAADAEGEAKSDEKGTSLVEKYGVAAIVTLLGLLALQLVVLTPLVRYGVDLSRLMRWVGADPPAGDGTMSWGAALAIAYIITRGLKVISLPAALALTPIVARVMGTGAKDEADE